MVRLLSQFLFRPWFEEHCGEGGQLRPPERIGMGVALTFHVDGLDFPGIEPFMELARHVQMIVIGAAGDIDQPELTVGFCIQVWKQRRKPIRRAASSRKSPWKAVPTHRLPSASSISGHEPETVVCPSVKV